MGIITREVVKSAQASKTKAFDFIRDEEPELFNAINDEISSAARKIGEAITQRNVSRIQELFTMSMREILGLVFFAETMAEDVLNSRKNPKLISIVKTSYDGIADQLSKGAELPELAKKDSRDALDAAIDDVTGKG